MPSFLLNFQVKSPLPPLETDPTGPHLGVPGGGGGGPLGFSTNDFCDYLRRRITPVGGDLQNFCTWHTVQEHSIYKRTKDCEGPGVAFFVTLHIAKRDPNIFW
jgi:hypothetical protein